MHLSVVIPTLGRPATARLMAARFRELFPQLDLEVLIVTPSGRSGSEEPEVRYVQDNGGGVYRAYTAGIRSAKGEYVWLVGDDDYPLDSAAKLGSLLLEGRVDLIVSPVIFSSGRFYGTSKGRLALLLRNWCQQGVIYRRSALARHRFYRRLKIQADHFVNILMNADSSIVKCFLPEPVCLFGVQGITFSGKVDWAFNRLRPLLAKRTLGPVELTMFQIREALAWLRRRAFGVLGLSTRPGLRP